MCRAAARPAGGPVKFEALGKAPCLPLSLPLSLSLSLSKALSKALFLSLSLSLSLILLFISRSLLLRIPPPQPTSESPGREPAGLLLDQDLLLQGRLLPRRRPKASQNRSQHLSWRMNDLSRRLLFFGCSRYFRIGSSRGGSSHRGARSHVAVWIISCELGLTPSRNLCVRLRSGKMCGLDSNWFFFQEGWLMEIAVDINKGTPSYYNIDIVIAFIMCIYIYIYVYTYTHIYIYMYIHIHIWHSPPLKKLPISRPGDSHRVNSRYARVCWQTRFTNYSDLFATSGNLWLVCRVW